jgi:hypothetical protein
MVTPHVRLIVLATRGVMEILGLVPYQSQTQYLEGFFELVRRGNIVEIHFRFVSSSFPLPVVLTGTVEIERKYISTLVSTSNVHILNGGKSCNARETP